MSDDLVITEGIAGYWSFHLSAPEKTSRALCGVRTMPTEIPLSRWDKTPPDWHIPESWCKECAKHLHD